MAEPSRFVRMDRRKFLWAAATAAGCRRVTKGRRKLSVALGSFHTMSPFYVAQERGYFRDAGFDLDVHIFRTASEAMPLMAQGALDAGLFVSSPGLCNLIAQGARVRIAASREFMTDCIDVGALYENKKRFAAGDGDALAWKGKRIAAQSRGSISHYALDAILKSFGLRDSAAHVVFQERAAGLAALLSGGVDAMLNGFAVPLDFGPRGGEFKRNGAGQALLKGVQYSYILFSKSLLDGDAETGADFLQAYFRGTRDFQAGMTPAFLEKWIRDNGLDRDTIVKLCRDTFVPDGSVSLSDLQKYLDWLAELQYIQPMQAQGVADTRCLERAQQGRS